MRIVTVATHPDRYLLTLGLDDGTSRLVDVEPFLWGPVFEPLLTDRELFDQASVDRDAETVVWPNGADIAPETLLQLAVQPTQPA